MPSRGDAATAAELSNQRTGVPSPSRSPTKRGVGKPAANAVEFILVVKDEDKDITRRSGGAGRTTDTADVDHRKETKVDDDDDENGTDNNNVKDMYVFEGQSYASYQEMVNAKRSRNQQMLIDSGLLDLTKEVHVRRVSHDGSAQQKKKRKLAGDGTTAASTERRKSNRLAGIQSDGVYVEEERAGRFLFATRSAAGGAAAGPAGRSA